MMNRRDITLIAAGVGIGCSCMGAVLLTYKTRLLERTSEEKMQIFNVALELAHDISNCKKESKEEVERYKTLWKRECEAYKDLAIKTGNWDVEEV